MTMKVSPSSLGTYESCPRKYRYQYIDKLPKKSFEHLDLGNYVHEVLDKFHRGLKDAKDKSHESILKQLAKDLWPKYAAKISVEGQNKAKGLLKDYLGYIAVHGIPEVIATEESFSLEVAPGIIIRGVVDRIDRLENGRMRILDYKGLALDTPIPTPSGWTRMEDLQVGDYVIGSDGKPTKVTIKSGIHNRPCYTVTLSDGSSVVCDNVHLWNVDCLDRAESSFSNITVSADRLFELISDKNKKIVIKTHAPLRGLDEDVAEDSPSIGTKIRTHFSVGKSTEQGLDFDAQAFVRWLRAPFAQRLALFLAIFDPADIIGGMVSASASSKEVRDFTAELCRTFGIAVSEDDHIENGRVQYSLGFSVRGRDLFSCRTEPAVDLNTDYVFRQIISVEKVASQPTACIAVDALDSLYLCGNGFITTHNTGKSKYLDAFQVQIYGLYLKQKFPEIQSYDGMYLVLPEGPKELSYDIDLKTIEETRQEIVRQANEIASDTTWAPKPTRLCNYCDFFDHCPDAYGKPKKKDDLVKIGKRVTF